MPKNYRTEPRTLNELRQHYEVEKELADRLRNATRLDRRALYADVYNELYQRVPLHPQLVRKQSPEKTAQELRFQLAFLQRFLKRDANFLEIGPGDCSLSFEVAKQVKQVYAVDVSDEITRAENTPSNFQLILSDGSSIPVTPDSINVAYSNQLMEHLHPDDALEQLHNIYMALARGGAYVCVTPNKLTGPHDISMYFDQVATGFHLKEYRISELVMLFKRAGFSRVKVFVGGYGFFVEFSPMIWIEKILESLPARLSSFIFHTYPFDMVFLSCRVVGIK